jgi:hypothetical protein
MMRKFRLKQIAPMRLGITLGILQGLLSCIFLPIVFFAGAFVSYFEHTLPGVPWVFAAGGALFMPIANGVAGFLGGVLIATAFNFVARWIGGVDFIVEDHE